MTTSDTNVPNLIINTMTRATYDTITPSSTELYMLTDEIISSEDVTDALGYTPYDSTNPDGFISGITSTDVTTALGYTPYDSTNPDGYITSSAVGTGVLTIQKNGTAVDTFSANASSNKTINITVPTNNNELTNGAGYITGITSSDVTTALGYTPYSNANPDGYQANVLEAVKVNGTEQTITSKAVDLTIGAGVLTIQKNGTAVDTFSANATADKSINLVIPVNTIRNWT